MFRFEGTRQKIKGFFFRAFRSAKNWWESEVLRLCGPEYFFRFNVVKVHPNIKEWKEILKVKKAPTIARHCYGKGVFLSHLH